MNNDVYVYKSLAYEIVNFEVMSVLFLLSFMDFLFLLFFLFFCCFGFCHYFVFFLCNFRICWQDKRSSMTITGIQYVFLVGLLIYGCKLTGLPLSGVCYVCITSTFYCPYKGVSYRVSCRFFF